MPVAPPTSLALLLVALVVIMAGLATAGVNLAFNAGRSPERRRALPAMLAAAGIAAWLTVTGVLASRGFFVDFTATPPRFALAIVPAILTVATISYLAGVGRPLAWLTATPPTRLLWMQSFRVAVEAVLWALYASGAMAALMTFEGANFDILIGLTAPLAAVALIGGHRRLALAWNGVGMLLLLTVLTLGVLSSPTRFQLLFTDPPNLALLTFPYIWIPAFLLPLGAAMHVLSIRQLLGGAKYKTSLAPVSASIVPTGFIGDTK